MKKILLPAICILSVTLFSFSNNSEDVFELQPDGNYLVRDGSKIEQADLDMIYKNSKVYDGTDIYQTYTITNMPVTLISLTHLKDKILIVDLVNPKDPKPTELMNYLLTKYNK